MMSIRLATAIAALGLVVAAAPACAAIHRCFTSGQDCTNAIVQAIDAANKELLVQAYGFTSCPIIAAIGRAKKRGVKVKVLLDLTNEQERYAGVIAFLRDRAIEPLIDHTVKIQHNKVIVIDLRSVLTGSFNFTASAQKRNAENLVIIRSRRNAREYRRNWHTRAAVSRPVSQAAHAARPACTTDGAPAR
jgi:phosphatidylserine/phosphatidylglycerophosphate/cardiolipin synthase-like enzyme